MKQKYSYSRNELENMIIEIIKHKISTKKIRYEKFIDI